MHPPSTRNVANAPPAARPHDREAASVPPETWGALMEAAHNGHGGAYRRLLLGISP